MIGYREGRRNSDNEPIHTEKIFADRKIFFLDLKENDRGKFLKITEDVRGRRDTILLPTDVLDEFLEALHKVADFNDDNPSEAEPSEHKTTLPFFVGEQLYGRFLENYARADLRRNARAALERYLDEVAAAAPPL